jgi:hypothetical protein
MYIPIKPRMGKRYNMLPRRRGLILDYPMLGMNDFNDYSGTVGPGDAVVVQSTGGWEPASSGPAFRCTGESSSHILIPVPSTLTDWPMTLIIIGTVTTLSGEDMEVSLGLDGEHAQMMGLRLINGEAQSFIYTEDFEQHSRVTSAVVGDDVIIAWSCVSSTERYLYFNGELLGDETGSDTFPTGSGTFYMGIGTFFRDTPDYDPGIFSCVRLYNRALTVAEIKEITDDPWADYRQDDNELWAGSAIGGTPLFNAAWAQNSNIIL